MISFIKEKLNNRRYRSFLQKAFEPDQKFLEQTRVLFLENLSQKAPKEPVAPLITGPSRLVLKLGMALVLLFLFLNIGLIFYAKDKDLGPDDAFYAYKRAAENIQITFTPANAKPFLHDELARRRLEEISKIKNLHIIKYKNLDEDFYNEVNAAITAASEGKIEKSKVEQLCKSLLTAINEYNKIMPEATNKLPDFSRTCSEFMHK